MEKLSDNSVLLWLFGIFDSIQNSNIVEWLIKIIRLLQNILDIHWKLKIFLFQPPSGFAKKQQFYILYDFFWCPGNISTLQNTNCVSQFSQLWFFANFRNKRATRDKKNSNILDTVATQMFDH